MYSPLSYSFSLPTSASGLLNLHRDFIWICAVRLTFLHLSRIGSRTGERR